VVPGDVQVLDHDGAVLAGQGRAEFVDRIASLVADAVMDTVPCRVGFAPAVGGPLADAPVRACLTAREDRASLRRAAS
jgi:hypothetical protein